LHNAHFYYIENAIAHVNNPIFKLSFIYYTCIILGYFAEIDCYSSLFTLITIPGLLVMLIRPRITADWLFSGLILIATLFAVVKPGTPFYHYMLFVPIPALVFLMTTLQIVASGHSSPSKYFVKAANILKQEHALSISLIIVWLFTFNGFAQNVKSQVVVLKNSFVGYNEGGTHVGYSKNISDISQIILHQTQPDDYIVVWGWEARINIYTNRRSATAQSDIQRLVYGYPHENITLYINHIQTNQPKMIVDVVTPGSFVFEEEKFRLENQKEIWDAIKDDYKLTSIYPIEGGSYKIYTRKKQ
jgi:hypothetical protein